MCQNKDVICFEVKNLHVGGFFHLQQFFTSVSINKRVNQNKVPERFVFFNSSFIRSCSSSKSFDPSFLKRSI